MLVCSYAETGKSNFRRMCGDGDSLLFPVLTVTP